MMKKRIAVIFGGCSSEYKVSLESAAGVLTNLDDTRFIPVMIGITSQGAWYHYIGGVERIAADAWMDSAYCEPALPSPNKGESALLVLRENGIERLEIDAIFPVLHGKNGEDGTVQGLCELAGIPLVGCGTLASALCMDKDRAHQLVQLAGIRVPRSFVLERWEIQEETGRGVLTRQEGEQRKKQAVWEAEKQAEQIGYPLFVKPVKAGSSYGISKVSSREELTVALQKALCYDNQVLIEEEIQGFEVGCAVIGRERLLTGEVDEIELAEGFFDYTEKYQLITSRIHVPARIEKEKAEQIKCAAKTIYRALGCSGFARVDLFLTPSGELVFNEVNTIPGLTSHSRFPGMLRAAGFCLQQVITLVIEAALAEMSEEEGKAWI